MAIHAREKPYKCTVCEKSYTNAIAMKVHVYILAHPRTKDTACVHRQQVFTNVSSLKLHKLLTHNHLPDAHRQRLQATANLKNYTGPLLNYLIQEKLHRRNEVNHVKTGILY